MQTSRVLQNVDMIRTH